MKKANDYKCHKCKKKQAVAFFPRVDPDIPSHPYCQVCLHIINAELFFALADVHKKKGKTK